MGDYAVSADAIAKVPGRTIDGTTEPSTTDVDDWINEAEGILNGALAAAQINPIPVVDPIGVQQLKSYTLFYAIGNIKLAFASGGGDSDNEDGEREIDRFFDFVTNILDNPSLAASRFSGGSAPDSARKVRGHTLDAGVTSEPCIVITDKDGTGY